MLLPNALHLLCFGDSLTAGFSRGGALYHPYTIALTSTLENSFPSLKVTTDNRGVRGDQAISPPGSMLPRMQKLYEELHLEDPYDWAIILGGTNDVSSNRDPKDVYIELQKAWSVPLSHCTKVLALTIPGCGRSPSLIEVEGGKLNKFILNHKAKNFYTFDLRTAVPWDVPEEKRNEIWDDPVHFTAKGYDLIGRLLADRLTEIIQAQSEAENKPGRPELKRREFVSG